MADWKSEKVLLLDGGLSNDLNNRVAFDINSEALWTAKALHVAPEAIVQTHLAYLKAGADIIETASYQATVEGFQDFLGIDADASCKLIGDSVSLAKKAVVEFLESGIKNQPLVAGSIGPYGVYLCDGSEYTGVYMKSVAKSQIEKMHLPRILSIVEAKADILAIETMPSVEEVEIILNLVKTHAPEMKVWVSFSIKEGYPTETASGDCLEAAYKLVSGYSQVIAFGINCCSPKDVEKFLQFVSTFKKDRELKLVAYPNSGQQWIRGQGWINESVPTLDTYLKTWLNLGVKIVGGCCQVGPEQISKMKMVIDEWNQEKGLQ